MKVNKMNYVREAVKNMSAYIPGEKAVGDGYIILNANENPYPPSPEVITAIIAKTEFLKWYPESSSKEVRLEAEKIYGIAAEQIMLTNSSDEMLRIICQACVEKNDIVYAFYPTFSFYETLAAVQGADFRYIEFNSDYSLPQLPDFMNTKVIFFPNPAAPSSIVYSLEEICSIIEAAPDSLVVIDEAYADFDFNRNSALSLLSKYENLFITKTFSKSYSLAGLRAGLGFGSKQLIAEFNKVRDYYNQDLLAQAGAKAALADRDNVLENCTKIVNTRKWFSKELAVYAEEIYPSATNFILARFKKGIAVKLYNYLKEQKILVRYWDKDRLADCLRISIGLDSDMKIVLEQIKKYFK